MFNKPVLFMMFARLESALKVFERIRAVRPRRIFLAADGPRVDHPGEDQKCIEVRERIVGAIDWECEIHTLFRKENLGCKYAIASAISWFFENVEDGVILEDDCLPELSFFSFCEAMLDKFSNESRIGHIGGFNCQEGIVRGTGSYYFSKYFHVWGWASWRRAWDGYEVDMNDYPQFSAERALHNLFNNSFIENYWDKKFSLTYQGKVDTWDYQWVYRNFKADRISIIPNVNLIRNIGFTSEGTHTKTALPKIERLVTGEMRTISHPVFILPDVEADLFTYREHCGLRMSEKTLLEKAAYKVGRIKNKIRNLLCPRSS
jgi:hypothetical protein